jgi:pimeloyl-ACP methyl ester carboxylesterase
MDRIDIDGLTVEYQFRGEGEPVVFIHATPFVPWYQPLIERLEGWSRLSYIRPADNPAFEINTDATLCKRLLDQLGIARPHLVGHSYGGLVALAVAGSPDVTPRSLALLEPATSGLLDPKEAMTGLAPLLDLARGRGPVAALDAFLRMICGDDGPESLEVLIPGALQHARASADQFFAVELPAAIRWRFDRSDATAITCPVLNLRGSNSETRFARAAEIIQSTIPWAKPAVMAGVGHLLMAADPSAAAELLTAFWSSTS